jgi:hypothetical protein
MSSDLEELVREGMRQVTATMHVSPDLAARACQRHRRRARRTLTGLAVGAAAGGAVVAMTVLAPAGHRASHQPIPRLAAWTVTKLTGGNISVTIRELPSHGINSEVRRTTFPSAAGRSPTH